MRIIQQLVLFLLRLLQGILVVTWLSNFLFLIVFFLKHFGIIALAIGAFLPRQDQTLLICLKRVLLAEVFGKEFGDVGVIHGAQTFMHTSHDPDIIVVELVDLLEIQHVGQFTQFISKEELRNCLRNEGWRLNYYRFLLLSLLFPLLC